MIDDITINIWFYWYFVSMEDIRRKCDPMVDLSKFIFNKKKLSRVAALMYNQESNDYGMVEQNALDYVGSILTTQP